MTTGDPIDGAEIRDFMQTLSTQLDSLFKQQNTQTEMLQALVSQPSPVANLLQMADPSLLSTQPLPERHRSNLAAAAQHTTNPGFKGISEAFEEAKHEEAKHEEQEQLNGLRQKAKARSSTKESIVARRVPQCSEATPIHELELTHAEVEWVEHDEFASHRSTLSMAWLADAVTSAKFEIALTCVIILNSIVMGIELQFSGMDAGVKMNFPKMRSAPDNYETIFDIFNEVFLWIFVAELLIKVFALRLTFWKFVWNWIDLGVVLFGVVERFGPEDGLDPMIIRLLRLAKLSRVLKFFKMGSHLQSWHLILRSIAVTRDTLFWSMLLLFMIQCIAGMLVAQLAWGIFTDESIDIKKRREVFRYFGTFTKTQFTMFEVTFVNYAPSARVLIDNGGETWAFFFITYRCLVSFAVMQVIRAVFIQQTLKVAETDKELLLVRKQTEEKRMSENLGQIFDRGDQDKTGFLNYDKFKKLFEDPAACVYMQTLDVDPGDVHALWHLLDLNGNGKISRNEFILGSSKVRGKATSIDMFQVHDMTEQIINKLEDLQDVTDRITYMAYFFKSPAAADVREPLEAAGSQGAAGESTFNAVLDAPVNNGTANPTRETPLFKKSRVEI